MSEMRKRLRACLLSPLGVGEGQTTIIKLSLLQRLDYDMQTVVVEGPTVMRKSPFRR